MPKGKGGQEDGLSERSKQDSPVDPQPSSSLEQRESRQLKEISKKLSLILTAIETLTNAITDRNVQINSPNNETISPALTEMTQVLNDISSNITSSREQNTEMLTRTQTLQAEEQALKIKTLWSNKWDFKMKKRKEAFWNMVKNKGHYETYEQWICAEITVVPRYLQRKKFINEQPNQQAVRASAALNDYRAEIELQKLRADQNKERYLQIDKEMFEFIEEKSTGQTRQILTDIWEKETARNESISKRRWKKNERWLQQYEDSFKEEYKDKNQNPFFKTFKETNTYNKEIRSNGAENQQTEQTTRITDRRPFIPPRTGGRNSRQLRLNSVRPDQRNNFLKPRDDNFQSRQQQSDNVTEETFLEQSDSSSTLT